MRVKRTAASWFHRRAPLAIAFVLVTAGLSSFPREGAAVGSSARQPGDVYVVELQLPALPEPARDRAPEIASGQDALLADLVQLDVHAVHRYQAIPALALEIPASSVGAVQQHALVRQLTPDRQVSVALNESAALINADDVYNDWAITGAGVTVAVLDTGIDTDHPDLADDIAYEVCFSVLATCPGGGTTATGGGAAEDANGHGTNVSGVVTSNGNVAPRGIAPDATIVAYRVLESNGSGSYADIIAALDDILMNHPEVDVINMSLSDSGSYGACDALDPVGAAAVNDLRAAGTITFAASGNNGYTAGISWPACLTNVVSTGAVWDATLPTITHGGCTQTPAPVDAVTCFSNSSVELDLLAPGAFITAPGLGGGVSTYGGTSQASPTAAAVAALVWQSNPSLVPATIETILETTGAPITDNRNSLVRPRVDAQAAVLAAGDGDGDGLPSLVDNCPAIANPTQDNADANTRPNGPMLAGDDGTWMMSDEAGDACDMDDDNDGLTDTDEESGAACGGTLTSPLLLDHDGDHLTDGWECAHGSDPTNPTSKFLGSGSTDADSDRLFDIWGERGYGGTGSSTDSDADGCHDMVEAASVDANKTVGDADRLAVARRALGIWVADPAQDHAFDVDKNGTVGDPDRLFVARAALLPAWQPKTCA
jgi:subtilisin family serine protease